MKRRHVALLAFIAAICIHLVPIVRREVQYTRSVNSYSDVLKPGLKRSEVEAYLRSKGMGFSRMCCVGVKRGAFDDIVEIGHEKAGWVCTEQTVYVAFEFTATEPQAEEWIDDSDRLVDVSQFRSVCLELP